MEARLDAVLELRDELSDVAEMIRDTAKRLSDPEKLLTNIHAFGSKHRAESHPDSRARLYEMEKSASLMFVCVLFLIA
jgi:DNA mismatch repair protein MSH6